MRSGNLNHILGKFSDAIKATEINCFLVHFSSYFTGLIPIKIRTRLRPASGGFVLAFQQENTRRLRICSLFAVVVQHSQTHVFFSYEGRVRTILGPHSSGFGAEWNSFFKTDEGIKFGKKVYALAEAINREFLKIIDY